LKEKHATRIKREALLNRALVIDIPDSELVVGSSLGNDKCWVTSKGTGAVQSLFSTDLGRNVFGSFLIRYCSAEHTMIHQGCMEDAATTLGFCLPGSYIQLHPVGQGIFQLHPAFQCHRFELPSKLEVAETFFVPCTQEIDPALACVLVELTNHSDQTQRLHLYGYCNLRGNTPCDMRGRFDSEEGALVAWNQSQPEWARVFGCTEAAKAYETTYDVSQVSDPVNVMPLKNLTEAEGEFLGALQIELPLEPKSASALAFIMAFSPHGEQEAKRIYRKSLDYERAFSETIDYYQKVLLISEVVTPDPVINEGVLWAKANMVRVMAEFPTGAGFTNNPGISPNVVARDVAWYIYGCDFFQPAFSRKLLMNLARLQQENGKIFEYYDGRTGDTNDYGLNINDDTPLFILAATHYMRQTADFHFLELMFPAIEKAARYIISQKNERGLVYCSSTGEGPQGIAGWRNIIPHYTQNGEVTEINSECYAALVQTGLMAKTLGKDEETVKYFAEEARKLKESINKYLLNPINGMYFMNIDTEGQEHPDVTGDEVFPVIFGVSAEPVSFRIVSRLNSPDFWTKAGMRTVSRGSPDYAPDEYSGLRGGVWPGLSFWYAFAASRYHPEFMMKALSDSYGHYIRNPKVYNTVPGQFSEWFDGESLVNRGMRLSPWEPPRFLWAAIEGACGVKAGIDVLVVDPFLSPEVRWIALKNMSYRGNRITFFAARHGEKLFIYTSFRFDTPHTRVDFKLDVSQQVELLSREAVMVAFAGDKEFVFCLGNTSDMTVTIPFIVRDLLKPDVFYKIQIYDSELLDWIEGRISLGSEMSHLAARIEHQGFRIFRLQETL
jgi:GH15 family glucan-1,4-alpha-glucosidase